MMITKHINKGNQFHKHPLEPSLLKDRQKPKKMKLLRITQMKTIFNYIVEILDREKSGSYKYYLLPKQGRTRLRFFLSSAVLWFILHIQMRELLKYQKQQQFLAVSRKHCILQEDHFVLLAGDIYMATVMTSFKLFNRFQYQWHYP